MTPNIIITYSYCLNNFSVVCEKRKTNITSKLLNFNKDLSVQYNDVKFYDCFQKVYTYLSYIFIFLFYCYHHTSIRYIHMIITFNDLFHMHSACTNTQRVGTYIPIYATYIQCATNTKHEMHTLKRPRTYIV